MLSARAEARGARFPHPQPIPRGAPPKTHPNTTRSRCTDPKRAPTPATTTCSAPATLRCVGKVLPERAEQRGAHFPHPQLYPRRAPAKSRPYDARASDTRHFDAPTYPTHECSASGAVGGVGKALLARGEPRGVRFPRPQPQPSSACPHLHPNSARAIRTGPRRTLAPHTAHTAQNSSDQMCCAHYRECASTRFGGPSQPRSRARQRS